jgi:hypothetical protein
MRFEHNDLLAMPEAILLSRKTPAHTCNHFNVILT